MRYVIDASVALRWYLEQERHENADAVLARLVAEPVIFSVPELFAFEVFSVLHRVHPKPLEAFLEGIAPLLSSGLLRYPMTEGIARRAARLIPLGMTGYDAIYAALAEELGAVWLTFDGRAHACLAAENLSVDLGAGLPRDW